MMYFLTNHHILAVSSTIPLIGVLILLTFMPVNRRQCLPSILTVIDSNPPVHTVLIANSAEVVDVTEADMGSEGKQARTFESFLNTTSGLTSIGRRMVIHGSNRQMNKSISPAFQLPLRV